MSNFKTVYDQCIEPTNENPFMNYIALGDEFKKPCDVSREEIDKKFLNANDSTASKIFYTAPIRPELSGLNFANFIYGNTSTCRDTGYLCKINSEGLKDNDRIITSYDKNDNLYKIYSNK